MTYLYSLATGEYVGVLNPDAAVPSDAGSTEIPPPEFTDTHIGVWNGAGWDLTQRPSIAAKALDVAWSAADAHARAGIDENSRASLLWLAVDPACPAWRRERILAVQAWWSSVWTHYATVRAMIQGGMVAEFDPSVPGDCPWTIWQIAASDP